jgi:hypothetical protein
MSKKTTRRSKPYTIRIGDKQPHQVTAADWNRFARMGLIEPSWEGRDYRRATYAQIRIAVTDTFLLLTMAQGVPSNRVAQLCHGVVAWLEAGRIVLQNLFTKVTAFIRTSWAAIERNCPVVISQETVHYWHCLTDQQRVLWDAWRESARA